MPEVRAGIDDRGRDARPAGRPPRLRRSDRGESPQVRRAGVIRPCDAIRPAERTGLDLAGIRRDRDIGDRSVLGFAGPMADDRREVVLLRQTDRIERLGRGT